MAGTSRDGASRNVTVLPTRGDVFVGRDAAGRMLRVSGHPDDDRVVLSIWQGATCVATVRLASGDIPQLVHTLVAAALPELGPAAQPRPMATARAPDARAPEGSSGIDGAVARLRQLGEATLASIRNRWRSARR